MHHRQWMVGDVHMDLCQRPPRPADGIECLSAPLGQPFLACQRFGKNALQHMRPARAYIGDSKRTERQGKAFMHLRSEERRVGKEGVRTCISRCSPSVQKKKKQDKKTY